MRTKLIAILLFVTCAAIGVSAPFGDKDLVKITSKRIPMDKRLLTLCVGPGAVVGPHDSAEVDIYANEAVLKYRKKNPNKFDYPIGSTFVKKKYPAVGAKKPDIATTMVRTGDKGAVSDWEFGMMSLPDSKPIRWKARVSCAECHEKYEESGYISDVSEKVLREYLELKPFVKNSK